MTAEEKVAAVLAAFEARRPLSQALLVALGPYGAAVSRAYAWHLESNSPAWHLRDRLRELIKG